MKKLFYTIAASLLICVSATAAVPGSFKWQAVVRDGNGAVLADKEVSVNIRIHQGEADGTILYGETHTATTSESGIVYLNIGEGDAGEASLQDLNWADGPYFLEVEMDKGEGFENIGTQELLSVPYAEFAGNAEKVVLTSPNGKQWNVIIDDNGELSTEEVK